VRKRLARKAPRAGQAQLALVPDVGLDRDLALVEAVELEPVCLALPARPGAPEPGGRCNDQRPDSGADVEFVPLDRGGLVDMPRGDQVDPGLGQLVQDVPAARERALARSPGRAG